MGKAWILAVFPHRPLLRDPSPHARYASRVCKRRNDFELQAQAVIAVFSEGGDPRLEHRAAVELPRYRGVIRPGKVAKGAPAPFHPHCVRVVPIVGLADDIEAVSGIELAPDVAGFVMPDSGE